MTEVDTSKIPVFDGRKTQGGAEVTQYSGAGALPLTLHGQNPKGIQLVIDQFKDRIAASIPTSLTPERLIQVAVQLIYRTPKLKDCSTASLIGAIMNAASLGLDLTPALGQCSIVPYNNVANFQMGYRGYIQLARRSGEISSLNARVVYEKDFFDYELGLNEVLIHKPCREPDKGPLQYVYCIWRYKDGGHYFDVLDKAEVMRIKSHSPAAGTAQSPWNTPDQSEMWKKSAVKLTVKYVPIATEEMHRATAIDEVATTPDQFDKNTGVLDLVTLPIEEEEASATLVEGELAELSEQPVEEKKAPVEPVSEVTTEPSDQDQQQEVEAPATTGRRKRRSKEQIEADKAKADAEKEAMKAAKAAEKEAKAKATVQPQDTERQAAIEALEKAGVTVGEGQAQEPAPVQDPSINPDTGKLWLNQDEATAILQRMGAEWKELDQPMSQFATYDHAVQRIAELNGEDWRKYDQR